ncbi:MAG: hypothetical protein MZV70_18285 [Desulfobacterales bacterium]|nr:hypothetical protein [Desulfobacterales bacterium]
MNAPEQTEPPHRPQPEPQGDRARDPRRGVPRRSTRRSSASTSTRAKLDGFRKGHAPRERVKALFDHDIAARRLRLPHSAGPRGRAQGPAPESRQRAGPQGPEARGRPVPPVHGRVRGPARVRPARLPDGPGQRKRSTELAKEDVDKAMEEIRARAAEYVPVAGRGAADGDYAVVEMQGRDKRTKPPPARREGRRPGRPRRERAGPEREASRA